MRAGRWKLHFPHVYPERDKSSGRIVTRRCGLQLYDLRADLREGDHNDVAQNYPGIVERLSHLAGEVRRELGDSLTRQEGMGNRPAHNAAARN